MTSDAATLSKKRVLLDLRYHSHSWVAFDSEPPGPNDIADIRIDFPEAVWEALGKPERITVTIEPGDLINPEPLIGPNRSLVPAGSTGNFA